MRISPDHYLQVAIWQTLMILFATIWAVYVFTGKEKTAKEEMISAGVLAGIGLFLFAVIKFTATVT